MSLVIVCMDNSQYSNSALEFYIKNIHKPGNKVRVVHCPENWQNIGPMEGPTPGRLHELRQEAKANTAAISHKCQETLQAKGVPGEFVELNGKEPWEEICKEANKTGASLIVIGNRGQGTIRRTLLGSVSDSVLHHAHCPVLVCRGEKDHHKGHHGEKGHH